MLRRAVEIALAVVALIVTSPLMLAVAIYIRWDSPGPALFRQQRVGKDGHLFWFYKFRTLRADAREKFPQLYSYSYSPEEIRQLQFKREEDPRVTRAGSWLRKSTLDELPNFWNLLKGDVAIVGPRPEIPEMLQYYPPEQLIKFSVKPGITGLAQTRGRGRLKFQQTNAYDVEYVKTRSLWLDCLIVLKTIKYVIRLDGAF
jgi:lipopolysaccharide/colanic/teichoic acid biosynthesis glycosyltransferase